MKYVEGASILQAGSIRKCLKPQREPNKLHHSNDISQQVRIGHSTFWLRGINDLTRSDNIIQVQQSPTALLSLKYLFSGSEHRPFCNYILARALFFFLIKISLKKQYLKCKVSTWRLLQFGCGLYPKGLCAGGLVPNIAVLRWWNL